MRKYTAFSGDAVDGSGAPQLVGDAVGKPPSGALRARTGTARAADAATDEPLHRRSG
jgi:hypothetical protein